MVRVQCQPRPRVLRSPHTRGDGPVTRVTPCSAWAFSPHAWGWSAQGVQAGQAHLVLPTRVGMVREIGAATRLAGSSPHTRGDGPHSDASTEREPRFSPHAWGWSVSLAQRNGMRVVLPTRVGMVRSCWMTVGTGLCSPHTRGDGPEYSYDSYTGNVVLPTRVGMVRKRAPTAE